MQSPRSTEAAPKTVLIIEDDAASQHIFGSVLRHHGFHVLEAWCATEGLQMTRDHRPDLVIVDIGLPDIDGFEITRRLKSDPSTRDIPVVIATVHVFDRDREAAMAAGCDHFLPKPLEPRVLAAHVRRILEETDAPSTPSLS